MIRKCLAAIALVAVLSTPGLATAQRVLDCLQTWEDDWDYYSWSLARTVPGRNFFWRNICDRHVLVAYCITRGGDSFDSQVCERPPQYYQAFELMDPGYVVNATLNHGALHWAACFSPKWPVTNPDGDSYKCKRNPPYAHRQLPER